MYFSRFLARFKQKQTVSPQTFDKISAHLPTPVTFGVFEPSCCAPAYPGHACGKRQSHSKWLSDSLRCSYAVFCFTWRQVSTPSSPVAHSLGSAELIETFRLYFNSLVHGSGPPEQLEILRGRLGRGLRSPTVSTQYWIVCPFAEE